MVGVGVGEEDGVQGGQAGRESLQAELGVVSTTSRAVAALQQHGRSGCGRSPARREVQTGQGQPITGMPWLVPVPRKRQPHPAGGRGGQATVARRIGGNPLQDQGAPGSAAVVADETSPEKRGR